MWFYTKIFGIYYSTGSYRFADTKRRQRIAPGIGDTIFVLDSAKHVSSKMIFFVQLQVVCLKLENDPLFK